MKTIKYKAATWVSLLTMVVAIFISLISALAATVSNETVANLCFNLVSNPFFWHPLDG